MNKEENNDINGSSTPSRKGITPRSVIDMTNTISPMRIYVARCILDLKSSIQKKRELPVNYSLQENDHVEKKEKVDIPSSTPLPSHIPCPTLPKHALEEDKLKEIDIKEGYHLIIQAMRLFDSYPVNERIDIQSFSSKCGIPCQMTLCILTILNYLGLTTIQSNTMIKRSTSLSPSFLQDLIKSWKSSSIPSLLDKTSFLPNPSLQGMKGVTLSNDKPFPYSINPIYYEQPYHPEESIDQTDNRIDWSIIHSSTESSSQKEVVSSSFCFSGIPVFCDSERMTEIMEKYCYLLLRECVEVHHFSLFSFISKTIRSNYLYINERLSCIRLIVFVFQYLNLIQIQKNTPGESYHLDVSCILQTTTAFENLISLQTTTNGTSSTTKEVNTQFVKELIHLPSITTNSIKPLLGKYYPVNNYPSVAEVRENLESYINTILLTYQQLISGISTNH